MDELRPAPDLPVIRVLIVTDVSLFREGLRHLLLDHSDVQVVGSARPTDDIPALAVTHHPDIVLLDATTVRASEVVPRLTEVLPGIRLVAFAVAQEDEEEVLACAEAGVSGYVARNATVEELVAVLRSSAHGEVRCPPGVTATIFREMARLAPFRRLSPQEPAFTRRESEIARLMEDGLTNKEIATRLGIEVATVKNHVHNVLEKLHVRRRGDVAPFLHQPTRRLPRGTRPHPTI